MIVRLVKARAAGVFEEVADVVAGDIGKLSVTSFIVEEMIAVLPEGLVDVHSGAAKATVFLGDKRWPLPMGPDSVADDLLERLHSLRDCEFLSLY